MARIAASIEYDILDRAEAAALPLAADPGVELRFLAITAIDRYRLPGALWHPAGKPAADTPLIVHIHGSGANYARAPSGFLGNGLAAGGRAMLAINTRQHDELVATENFFDIRRDIEAAVATGRALGYRRLVLEGHSLGTLQVMFYAALNWDPDIKAVSLLGPFGNLPWKTRTILMQNEDRFRALVEEAMACLRAGRASERLSLPMGWFTGDTMPVTSQHFLTYRWEASSAADSTFWIRRVPQPVLMVRNESDAIIQPFEPFMLLAAAHGEGSLVESIKYVCLPDQRPRSLEGHSFIANEAPLVATITSWLGERGL